MTLLQNSTICSIAVSRCFRQDSEMFSGRLRIRLRKPPVHISLQTAKPHRLPVQLRVAAVCRNWDCSCGCLALAAFMVLMACGSVCLQLGHELRILLEPLMVFEENSTDSLCDLRRDLVHVDMDVGIHLCLLFFHGDFRFLSGG